MTIRNGRLVGEEADEEAPAEGEEPEMTVDSEAAALANIPLFAGISAKNLKLLAFSSQRITFAKDDVLIRQDEPNEAAYVLLSGDGEIVLGEGDDEMVVVTKGENTLLGELSLLSGTTATATVRTVGPVTALKIKKEVFIELIEGDAAVASHVARVVSDKLVESMHLLSKAA